MIGIIMKRIIFISILIGLNFSCQKDRLTGDKKILVGTWNWRSSLLEDWCLGFKNHTPENTGKTFKVVFTKKGTIQFYENNTILREHTIKFDELYIQTEGIVESYRHISFSIQLDGDPKNLIYGFGTPNEFKFDNFPFAKDEECVEHAHNYFRKE